MINLKKGRLIHAPQNLKKAGLLQNRLFGVMKNEKIGDNYIITLFIAKRSLGFWLVRHMNYLMNCKN